VGGGEEVSAMATTKDRLNEFIRSGPDPDAWVTAPEAPAPPAPATDPPVTPVARTPLGTRLQAPISAQQALTGMVAWVLGLAIGIAVEPPATNPNAVDPWFVSALGTILLVSLFTTLAGLLLRRRWSLAASLVAAGLLVLSTVMCPVSGHHANIGAWWVLQLSCGLGLLTASALWLRQATPR
jgi:hypothetical protein